MTAPCPPNPDRHTGESRYPNEGNMDSGVRRNDSRDKIAALPPLRDVIAAHGLSAEKSLGQNFLLDLNLTSKIVRLAPPLAGVHVIEIGPGPGGLTRAILLSDAAHVTAIDRDRRIADVLAPLVAASNGRLTLLEGDALDMDALGVGSDGARAIIANLPYNVATPLLFGWLAAIHAHKNAAFSFLHLMFQKEVADRITAQPNTAAYGRLSVMAQWLTDVKTAIVLPPSAFTPPPKVHSAVVTFVPTDRADNLTFKQMEQTVARAFNQRRKMLRAIFKGQEAALEAAHITPTDRAENLTVLDFVRLAQALPSGG